MTPSKWPYLLCHHIRWPLVTSTSYSLIEHTHKTVHSENDKFFPTPGAGSREQPLLSVRSLGRLETPAHWRSRSAWGDGRALEPSPTEQASLLSSAMPSFFPVFRYASKEGQMEMWVSWTQSPHAPPSYFYLWVFGLYHTHACCPQKPERVWSSGTGGVDSCEPLCGCWDSNPGPL